MEIVVIAVDSHRTVDLGHSAHNLAEDLFGTLTLDLTEARFQKPTSTGPNLKLGLVD